MRKKKDRPEGSFAEPQPVTRLGPLDVQQKEFGVMRVGGGYRMRDVDEFLDEITNSMTALVEENRRLREQVGSGAMIGAPDLGEVSRQADEIIHRAREEAARIIFEARAERPASTAPPGAGDRAAISAFLSREREFLQGLAGLVQGHAEAVKGMARDARDAATAGAAAATAAEAPSGTRTTPDPERTPPDPERMPPDPERTTTAPEPTVRPAPTPEPPPVAAAAAAPVDPSGDPATRAEAARPAPQDDVTTPAPSADRPTEAIEEPVRVDEPEHANVGRAEGDETPEEGDRSLRDLFWGED